MGLQAHVSGWYALKGGGTFFSRRRFGTCPRVETRMICPAPLLKQLAISFSHLRADIDVCSILARTVRVCFLSDIRTVL